MQNTNINTVNSTPRKRNARPNLPGQGKFTFEATKPVCYLCNRTIKRLRDLPNHLLNVHQMDEEVVKQVMFTNYKFVYTPRSTVASVQSETEIIEVEEENDEEVQDVESNSLFHDLLSGYMSDDELDEEDIIGSFTNDETWNNFTENCHPFPNLQTMVLMALVDGDNDMISRRILKKILFTINMLFTIKDRADHDNVSFKLPTLNSLLNFQHNKKNKIPVFPATHVEVRASAAETDVINTVLNLPSEHLKLMMANPLKSKKITSLPDRTPNKAISLQQGYKWRTHPLFQQPMHTIDEVDYWFGDLVYLRMAPSNLKLLVKTFHTDGGEVFVKGHLTRETSPGSFRIETDEVVYPTSHIHLKSTIKLNTGNCRSDPQPNTSQYLTIDHRDLITRNHRS